MRIKNGNSKINSLLKELESGVRNVFSEKLKNIYLFGSYARGDFDKESDIDVLIVVDDEDFLKFDDEVLDLSVDLSLKYDCVVSLFLESRENFIKFRKIKPLYKNIEKEGKAIYAA